MDLHEFKNHKGLLANGNACKPNCRTYFSICLKNYQAVVSPGDCIFGSTMTPVLGTNSFSAKDSGTFPKPIQFPFKFGWPVRAWSTTSTLFLSYCRTRLLCCFAGGTAVHFGSAQVIGQLP